MTSPTWTSVSSEAVLVSVISGEASRTSTLASSVSPAVSESGISDVAAVVIFVMVVPAAAKSAVPSSVNVAVAPFARLGIVHIPVAASYTPALTVPLLAVAVKPAGRRSVSVVLSASLGPLFVIVISNVTVSPISGVALPEARVLTVTRSASGHV